MTTSRILPLCLAAGMCSIASAQGIMTTGSLRIRIVPPDRPVTMLAGGTNHSAAVMDDGTIASWGRNLDGESHAPDLTQPATEIACGRSHTVALLADGSVLAWGSNMYGQTDPLEGAFTAIATGADHTLALRADGSVAATGDNVFGQCSPPEGIVFTAIVAGGYTSYGLDDAGEIHVWGFDGFDLNLPPDGPFVELACGDFHALARRASGSITGWGLDTNGETQPPATNYISIAAHGTTSGGITSGGDVLLWGLFDSDRLIEVPPGPFEDIVLGGAHALAGRADGSYEAWGSDIYGQSTTYFGGYERVRSTRQAVAALRVEDRQLVGWGLPSVYTSEWDEQVVRYPYDDPCGGPGDTYCEIATFELGWDVGMMVAADDRGRSCWTISGSDTPFCPGQQNGSFPSDISFGYTYRVGLYPGQGIYGGDIAFEGDYIAVSSGLEHVVAVAADGTVMCEGDGYHGQCTPPEKLPPDLIGIAAGETFTVGLRKNGTLVPWGGILGGEDDPYVGIEVTDAPTREDFVEVTAGNRHGLALTELGEVVGWGISDAGQYDFPVDMRSSGFDATASTSAVILDFDCDADGIVDAWAIRDELVPDCNGNGIPDSCDEARGRTVREACICIGDLNQDAKVDGFDLSQLLAAWGQTVPPELPYDLSGDGQVDGSDLTILLANWGACFNW